MRTVDRGALALLALLVAGCEKTLPEEPSAAASIYRERCGTCHRPYMPASLTWATWEMILPRMDQRIAERGIPPLRPEERAMIRTYLKEHAAGSG